MKIAAACRVAVLVIVMLLCLLAGCYWVYSPRIFQYGNTPYKTIDTATSKPCGLNSVWSMNANMSICANTNLPIHGSQLSWIQWKSEVDSLPLESYLKGLYWPGSIWPHEVKKYAQSRAGLPLPTRNMTILYWTAIYNKQKAWYGEGTTPFLEQKCPVYQCEYTTDKSRLAESDAVLVHWLYADSVKLPRTKIKGQKWVFRHAESPVNNRRHLRKHWGKFDIKISYELHMDVVAYFGGFIPIHINDSCPAPGRNKHQKEFEISSCNITFNYAEGKDTNSPVAWFVSNCHTQSRREHYVRELSKHIKVDIYGACGKLKCPRSSSVVCEEKLNEKYKFYLAFENSLCVDYITEKTWLRFHRNTKIVPVVLGGGNYSMYFPPHSYIDVTDFSSPAALAAYLHRLNHDDGLYNEFFQWRTNFKAGQFFPWQCSLCTLLHWTAGKEYISPQKEEFTLLKPKEKLCMTPNEYYGQIISTFL